MFYKDDTLLPKAPKNPTYMDNEQAGTNKEKIPLNLLKYEQDLFHFFHEKQFDSLISTISELRDQIITDKYVLPSNYNLQKLNHFFLELFDPMMHPELLYIMLPFTCAWTYLQSPEDIEIYAFPKFIDYLLYLIFNQSTDPNYDKCINYQLTAMALLSNLINDSENAARIFMEKDPIPQFIQIYNNPLNYYEIFFKEDDIQFQITLLMENFVNHYKAHTNSLFYPPIKDFFHSFTHRLAHDFYYTTKKEFAFLQKFVFSSLDNAICFIHYWRFCESNIRDYFEYFENLTEARIIPIFKILKFIFNSYNCFPEEWKIFIKEQFASQIAIDPIIRYLYTPGLSMEFTIAFLEFIKPLIEITHDTTIVFINENSKGFRILESYIANEPYKIKILTLNVYLTIFNIQSNYYPKAILNNHLIECFLELFDSDDDSLILRTLQIFESIQQRGLEFDDFTEFMYERFIETNFYDIVSDLEYVQDQNTDIIEQCHAIISNKEQIENKIDRIKFAKVMKERDELDPFKLLDFQMTLSDYSEDEEMNCYSRQAYQFRYTDIIY
ncbi:hypothetical protein TRFO_05731 [Tritrichomonas foetus]|uniref:Uncharacterized protein n=1 Tax=Tritrichomonas foetus TaxID=1144522 RepID=A0A1J4K5C6_9EUKA|nr:hypothetical protein TRFO_05731 [Tritrichomonas foetus]|eukprot:OHT06072.1 hypothetical protein TRFO_05731 [Tritrichomonas foetus]